MTLESPNPCAGRELAAWLMQEHAGRRRFVPFAHASGIDTLAKAYEVQREHVALLAAKQAAGRSGYKIGLTSTSMQAMCGIDSPVAGVILSNRVLASGAVLHAGDYGRFGVEFEIAVRMCRDLPPTGSPVSLRDVQSAVDAVAPAMEVVDDRNCDYQALDVLSLVADNAWNAGVVLGEFKTVWPDLATVEGRVWDAGGLLDTDRGRDVLGQPLQSVVWLANHLHGAGQSLRAGDIVMTGSMVTTKFPQASQSFRFEVDGLGAVELRFERQKGS